MERKRRKITSRRAMATRKMGTMTTKEEEEEEENNGILRNTNGNKLIGLYLTVLFH